MIDSPVTKGRGRRYVSVIAVSGLILLLLMVSCNSSGQSGGSAERLNAYCIRECVIETGDSEICDTRCKCAVEKLVSAMSVKEFSELTDGITLERESSNNDVSKLGNALETCAAEN